jgi:hypothetical protein
MKSGASKGETFRISFDALGAAAANQAALSLRTSLLDLGDPEIDVKIEKDSTSSQDFGTTLVLLIGTKAAFEIAKGIADWLRRRPDAVGLVVARQSGWEGDDQERILTVAAD